MKRGRLLWRVYPYFLATIVIALVLTALYAAGEMRDLYVSQVSETLETRARLVGRQLRPLLATGDTDTVAVLSRYIGAMTLTRITVIDTAGTVLGDSEEDPDEMEGHATRPEMARALNGRTGTATRFSNTLQYNLIYVAVPITIDGRIIGVVRASMSVRAVEEALNVLYGKIALGGLIVALLATIVGMAVLRRVTTPLKGLQRGAERFAAGEFEPKLPVSDIEEIGTLAGSMNRMAAQLDARIRIIAEERNEREAILSSMTEGVIALDSEDRIVTVNQAAGDLLGLENDDVVGRPYYEVIRISGMHKLVEGAKSDARSVEQDLVLPGESPRFLQANGATLLDSAGNQAGLVLVFHDITRLKELEAIRRDFVANVSHELKTPIAAIKGSVETLIDGAWRREADCQRFLDMIARHADRLNQLVEDLLALARLEEASQMASTGMTSLRLADILESSAQACQVLASGRNVAVAVECDPEIRINSNPLQMEQAVTNLIDNAIKWSDPGKSVLVSGEIDADGPVITVRDRGTGIEKKHLPRLFERFYRVDRARSRDSGGTGLGLAIVKHVALAHGGRVSVESTPGQGSIFRIHLPRSS